MARIYIQLQLVLVFIFNVKTLFNVYYKKLDVRCLMFEMKLVRVNEKRRIHCHIRNS